MLTDTGTDQIFVMEQACCVYLYLVRFENNWATAIIVKQYMSSTRYGRRKGYFTCAHEACMENRNCNLDDEMNNDE